MRVQLGGRLPLLVVLHICTYSDMSATLCSLFIEYNQSALCNCWSVPFVLTMPEQEHATIFITITYCIDWKRTERRGVRPTDPVEPPGAVRGWRRSDTAPWTRAPTPTCRSAPPTLSNRTIKTAPHAGRALIHHTKLLSPDATITPMPRTSSAVQPRIRRHDATVTSHPRRRDVILPA